MKRAIKELFLWFGATFMRDCREKTVFYHDVGTDNTSMGTKRDVFWAHMMCLREKNKERSAKGGGHVVAFDDGFRGIWDDRARFKEMGIRPIVFVAVDLVGKPGYLTWDEIRTLQNEYGFEFQCHTWSHQTLIGPVNTDLPPPASPDFRTDDWYHHELVDSKAELERQLNIGVESRCRCRKEVSALCFPVGNFSDEVIRRCAEAGYSNLYTSFPGNKDDAPSSVNLNLQPQPVKLIPRILCQSLSLFEFKLVLRGGMNGLRNRYLRRQYCERREFRV